MDLSIIIPSFNTKDLLRQCLESIDDTLQNSKLKCEVIVIDNASDDGSQQMVKKEFPRVTLIENKENLGYARANNRAVKTARGKYLLFLNSDIKVLGRGIEKLYNFLARNVEAQIAGGKLLNKDKSPQPSCGPFYGLLVTFAMLFLRGDRWGLTRYSPNKVKAVDWVSGACLCISSKAFNKLDGFDESIFMYMDEIEFLYRAKRLGYNVYFYPSAKFIHYGAASSKGKTKPILNIFRGLLYFYQKHKSGAELFVLQLMLLTKAILGVVFGRRVYRQAIREVINPK